MSSCEKCWRDSASERITGHGPTYSDLMEQRKSRPCTPEQQAGEEAGDCPVCGRKTMHQFTSELMCDCAEPDFRSRISEVK